MPFSEVPASCRDTVPQNNLGSLLVLVKLCPGSLQVSSAKGLDTPCRLSCHRSVGTPEADFLGPLPGKYTPTSPPQSLKPVLGNIPS